MRDILFFLKKAVFQEIAFLLIKPRANLLFSQSLTILIVLLLLDNFKYYSSFSNLSVAIISLMISFNY